MFVVGLCWFLLRFSKISSMIMAVPLSFNVLFCVFLLLCCIILLVLPSSAQSDNKLEPKSSSVFLEIVSSSSPYASGLQPVFAKLTISQHLALPAFLSLRLSLSSNRDLQDLTTRHSRFAHLMSCEVSLIDYCNHLLTTHWVFIFCKFFYFAIHKSKK